MADKIRVLVVDDSAHNRNALSKILTESAGADVVGVACDGESALKKVALLRPDLISLDLEMPKMDGFTFLRFLMSKFPTPVIVISSQNRRQDVFRALELGALDFIAKPSRLFSAGESKLCRELSEKIEAVRMLQIRPLKQRSAAAMGVRNKSWPDSTAGAATNEVETEAHKEKEVSPLKASKPSQDMPVEACTDTSHRATKLVCMGASTGGPPALQAVFRALACFEDTAVLVVQHMPEQFTYAFAQRLDRISRMKVQEAEHGSLILAGHVYLAPGGHHMTVTSGHVAGWHIGLTPCNRRDQHIPSIDQLFSSVAQKAGGNSLGVILTGMGNDGAEGIKALYEAGGKTVVESEESAVVSGMPQEAQKTGCVMEVLSLAEIIENIGSFCMRERG